MYDAVSLGAKPPREEASFEDESGEDQQLLRKRRPEQQAPPEASEPAARWRLAASSVGLLADAYDIFSIDLVLLILELLYHGEVTNTHSKSLMVSALLAGIILGQLAFGFVADLVGRKWAFVVTAGLTVAGAALSAVTFDRPGAFGLPVQLACCRFILGLGIGGEYPLSASVTAEATESPEERGFMLATVISMQGWGMLMSSLVAILALALSCSLQALWRLLLAFGALPSAVAFLLRYRLHESAAFSRVQSARRTGDHEQVSRLALIWRHWPRLLGTAASWLLMNVSLYSLGSFKSQVFHEFMGSEGTSHRSQVLQTARFAALTSCFAIAGFGAALLSVNRLGRFWIQLLGFAALAVLFVVQAALSSEQWKPPTWVFVTLLGLVFFFENFGPNTTTFIIPAEAFPTLIRATCHGISAATGKVGALIGTTSFSPLEAAYGMRAVYFVCAGTAAVGVLVTYGFTPRCPASPEKLDD